ncbi:MAG: PilZ domain-containing protein [Candidatus Methylomirabilales bacterium]
MNHTDTRQHPRFPLRLPVLCESPAVPDYRRVGFTHNVSRGGLLLEVMKPLSPGTPASLLLPTGKQNARTEAVVVWTAEGAPGRMGLRFTHWAIPGLPAWERLLALQSGQTPRTSVRTPVALEITCRIPPDTILAGQARNLSDGGLMIALPQALPPQTRLTMEVPPLSTLSRVEAEMEVVWTRVAREDRPILHGLRFRSADIDKELFLVGALLRRLVTTHQT